jgi:hypothetical protein
MVLSGGQIVEQGSHDELLASDGRYAAFWRAGSGDLDGVPPAAAAEEVGSAAG